jgi:uncharacterized membrane protein YdjX (TVP38/TMEM64 family)
MRLLVTALALGVLFLIPFLIWGGDFTAWFSGTSLLEWVRSWGPWGPLAILVLLVGDLFLPIPATPIMSAAGLLYGWWWGGLLSASGSMLAGLLGYTLTRSLGRRWAIRLAGEQELQTHESRFRRHGPLLVAASRWLPLLPEVISCLAGLTRMPIRLFFPALACGSLPLGFTYAAIGASGHEHPTLAFVLSLLLPPLLWFIGQRWFRSHPPAPTPDT